MSATPQIGVVVCAYADDRWADLADALAALAAQSRPPAEVVLVVDHNPRLLEQAAAAFERVRVVPNSEPRGLSGARNTGIAVVQAEVVAFLDDDAIPAPDWIERLQAAYDAPEVLGAGGAILPEWPAGRPGWFPDEFDWVVGCTYRGMPVSGGAVRNLIGANMSLRRSVFERVGGFRDGIGRIGRRPLGCEETELCIRLHQQWPGAVLRYEPRAVVRHRIVAHRATWAYFRERCYAEGLSKSLVTRLVGRADGLSSERTYVTRALPRGVVRNLADATRGDAAGLGRAAAIIAGLGVTATGYVVGTAQQSMTAARVAQTQGQR